MSSLKNLTIDRIEERTRKDNGDKFPVVMVAGVSFSISESGNSRFTLREVSIPLSNMSMAQAKEYFPPKSKLEGYEIYQKQVDPYEWETPEGETLTLSHSWDIRKIGEDQAEESASEPESTREPVEGVGSQEPA